MSEINQHAVNMEEEIVCNPLADSIMCKCGGHYKARRKFFKERHLETLKHQNYLTKLQELPKKKKSKRKPEFEIDESIPIEIIS